MILDKYGAASGQSINFEKSAVAFSSNMNAMDKQIISDFLNIPIMKGDSKYLGLPSFWGQSKAEAYNFLVEKSLNKMQGWKSKLISQGRKETLIKSVVQTIPTYAMPCFLLPKSICNKLDGITRNFWWKGNPEHKGFAGQRGINYQSLSQRGAWVSEITEPLTKLFWLANAGGCL